MRQKETRVERIRVFWLNKRNLKSFNLNFKELAKKAFVDSAMH